MHVAMLDGIMGITHKNSLCLLAEWKAAERIQRSLPSEPTTPPDNGTDPVSG